MARRSPLGGRAGCALAAAWIWPLVAHAGGGNFPPIANATADPPEVLVGQPVAFDSSGSLDPDDGPQPLAFEWDFGDGATSTEPSPTHSYAAVGLYVVTLRVTDGLDAALVNLDVVVLEPATPARPSRSAPLALTGDDAVLVVVNPDSNSVTFVDAQALAVLDEVDVGADPRSVALSADGSRAYVACRGANAVWVVDAATRSVVEQLPAGHMPHGVAAVPGEDRLVVAHEGDGTVAIVSPDDPASDVLIDVGGSPRAVAVDSAGSRAYVTHYLTRGDAGAVSVIDVRAAALDSTTTLAEDPGPDTASSGRGFPNLLGVAAIHPAGRELWVGGLKSNTSRGLYLSGEPLVPRNRLRGVMLRIDAVDAGEAMDRRIDTNDADSVSGIAFSPLGRFAFLVHQGAGTMSVYDLPRAALIEPGDGATPSTEARVDVGHAPQGVAITSDGALLFVANYMSRDVSVFDVTDPRDPVLVDTLVVTEEPLPPRIANGKRLFFRSREPVHSDQNYVACASCHPDGGHDGRSWDRTSTGEGLRNTIDLRGKGGLDHGPLHRSANYDEIQDFENDIVNNFGGEGLANDGLPPNPPLSKIPNAGRSRDLDDLALYVGSLGQPPPSPHRAADGGLTAAALRGQALFFDDAVGCFRCHTPPNFTDSQLTDDPDAYALYDVGTMSEATGKRLGGPLPGLDVPSLLGAWVSPPYLHDGSAASVRDVVTVRNPEDAHGFTNHLSDEQIDDLVAFVLSLDGSPDEEPRPPGGEDESSGGAAGSDDGSSDGSGTSGDAGSNENPDGCACAVHEPPPLWLVWTAVLGLRRRRQECWK